MLNTQQLCQFIFLFIFGTFVNSQSFGLIFSTPEPIASSPESISQDQQPLSETKNFSALAQSLVLFHKSYSKDSTTSSPPPTGRPRSIFDSNYEFCRSKSDGLYDDPDSCDKFIICYVQQTFRTKCADGTKWNHFTKECDYPVLGYYFYTIYLTIKMLHNNLP